MAVNCDGKPVNGPGLDRGIVSQQYALFPWRTALGNVEFGLENQKVQKKERIEIARKHLSLVGLSGFENHYPYQLSGGMKQGLIDIAVLHPPFYTAAEEHGGVRIIVSSRKVFGEHHEFCARYVYGTVEIL